MLKHTDDHADGVLFLPDGTKPGFIAKECGYLTGLPASKCVAYYEAKNMTAETPDCSAKKT